ncbi:acyl carrier protein [Streptomyces sp. AC550_RSS872]|uniref:acyl carrier protein n=1 Tax=Streptomyces sp. AC550_RSS872 TaxID=2823689 RepID=UPI001C26D8A1|nr:acyl carrier protein [Streptomyces sp. AC550_RSS872]
MATTLDTITQVLTETFPIDAADITPERTFDDLGLDSLALLEMGLAVQESTGITLNDTELPKTVGQLVTLLDAAQADVAQADPAPADPALAVTDNSA